VTGTCICFAITWCSFVPPSFWTHILCCIYNTLKCTLQEAFISWLSGFCLSFCFFLNKFSWQDYFEMTSSKSLCRIWEKYVAWEPLSYLTASRGKKKESRAVRDVRRTSMRMWRFADHVYTSNVATICLRVGSVLPHSTTDKLECLHNLFTRAAMWTFQMPAWCSSLRVPLSHRITKSFSDDNQIVRPEYKLPGMGVICIWLMSPLVMFTIQFLNDLLRLHTL